MKVTVPAGGVVKVTNGNSITLTPYIYHRFYAEGGELIVGEVSKVNDDAKDNHFSEVTHHSIEEDEPVRHLLCGGYVMGYCSKDDAPPDSSLYLEVHFFTATVFRRMGI